MNESDTGVDPQRFIVRNEGKIGKNGAKPPAVPVRRF
jgi:hypothetical protein